MLFPTAAIISRTISLASTNATSVKAGPCRVVLIYCTNSNAAARYVKLYNKASAPVVGTDIPLMTLLIPAANAIEPITIPNGIAFEVGLAFAMTSGIADTDSGNVGANDLILTLGYIN